MHMIDIAVKLIKNKMVDFLQQQHNKLKLNVVVSRSFECMLASRSMTESIIVCICSRCIPSTTCTNVCDPPSRGQATIQQRRTIYFLLVYTYDVPPVEFSGAATSK